MLEFLAHLQELYTISISTTPITPSTTTSAKQWLGEHLKWYHPKHSCLGRMGWLRKLRGIHYWVTKQFYWGKTQNASKLKLTKSQHISKPFQSPAFMARNVIPTTSPILSPKLIQHLALTVTSLNIRHLLVFPVFHSSLTFPQFSYNQYAYSNRWGFHPSHIQNAS